jgi:uncharacterized protein YqgC (DUF456 family)
MKKVLRIILGIILIVLGFVALVTPCTPGSWLALIGLEILGIRLLVQRKVMWLLPAKMRPRVQAWLDRLAENRWFQRLRGRDKPH